MKNGTPQFDEAELDDRLHAGSVANPLGNGYVARVSDKGPEGARLRKPDLILDSCKVFGDSGVFEENLDAIAFAVRWKAGHIAQQDRTFRLRVERGLGLAHRLQDATAESAELELQKKMIANQIRVLEDRRTALVREANDPEVELDIRPSGDAWRLYDAPSESEGTATANHRQLVLGGSGVDGPEPAEVEQDPPPKAAKSKKPKSAKSRAKAPKKRGKAARTTKPGLDPAAVEWPEDEPT